VWAAAGRYPKEFKEGIGTMVDLIMHNIGGNNITLVWIVEMNTSVAAACVHGMHVTLNLESDKQQKALNNGWLR
jgi:hypothetical protein